MAGARDCTKRSSGAGKTADPRLLELDGGVIRGDIARSTSDLEEAIDG